MLKEHFSTNLRYYIFFQILFVIFFTVLSSLGAFFHFQLNHEISIVESWLHNNHWEILILAKIASLYILNKWFRVKLYQFKPFYQLLRELIKWPDLRSLVISIFMLISFLALSGVTFKGQNISYFYQHFTSFFGTVLFFGIEFIVIAYLGELHAESLSNYNLKLSLVYVTLFTISFRMSVPDYYQLLPYVVFCFSTLLYLSGRTFKSWSNVVCFLFVFVAPMASVFGMDPVWGNDFSLFSLTSMMRLPFLAVIWMISFLYYKYRDQFISWSAKYIR